MSTIGERIKAKRSEFGWSQQQLADFAGVSQQLIGKLETGKVRETRKAGKIAKALGVSVDTLLSPSGAEQIATLRRHKRVLEGTRDALQSRIDELVAQNAYLIGLLGRTEGKLFALASSLEGWRQSNYPENQNEQEAGERPSETDSGGKRACVQDHRRSDGGEDHAEGGQRASVQGGCGDYEAAEADTAPPGSKEALGPESVSRLGAADPLKAGPAEVPVIAGSAPATGQSFSIENAPKLSMRNREAILATDTVSCYCCIRTFPSASIEHWTDQQRTAFCPTCGVDSVIPGTIPTELLIAMCERWFVPQPGDEL